MQLANAIVRIAGEIGNTVPKLGLTPAEILVLRYIHGEDAVVDIRPAGENPRIRQEAEYERLAGIYDKGAGSFAGSAGEEPKSIMATLFPGALKRLPMTLEEIGVSITSSEPAYPVAPDLPDAEDDDEELTSEADFVVGRPLTVPAAEAEPVTELAAGEADGSTTVAE